MQTVLLDGRASPMPGFGELLRQLRLARRLSQLDLAAEAQVSARHLCFLEKGRAQPSREMVQHLGATLDLPLDERNALHVAAGFVPPYGNRNLDNSELKHVRQALDFVLRQHEPFPAIVIDGCWNIRIRNQASQRLFSPFHGAYEMEPGRADNAMHVVFHPCGLRPFITNWAEFAGAWIQLLHREVIQGSPGAASLWKEVLRYPAVAETWRMSQRQSASEPVMTMQLRKDDYRLSFFSTLTSFALPRDIALQQLKIECFYPADDATAKVARRSESN